MIAVILILTILTLLFFFLAHKNQKRVGALLEKLQTREKSERQLEELLESCRNRDRQLIQNAGEALFVFNPKDGSMLEINRQAEELLGYTQGEVSSLTFKILFTREHRQRLLRMLNTVIKKGEAEVNEIKFRRKDGSRFLGEVKTRIGRLNDQQVVYGSFRDTTQMTNLQIDLRRHNRHLTLLNEISQRVAEGHDLPGTLEIILDEVIRSLAISGGGIFLLEHAGKEMKLALHRNIPDNVIEELSRIQPGMGLAGKVVETGRPRLSTNLQKDHRRISSAVFADNWRAFLAVPFIAKEEPLGVLFIFDRGNRIFSREDVRLIQAIGRQLGPLLKNAELFDELQWQHRLNFASLRELERSRATLRDNLDQLEHHHRTLQSLNKMKSDFLSLASHELRTPLTTILSGAEFLQSVTEDTLGANEKKALDVIMRGSQRLNRIVDDLLEAARLEAKTLYIEREAFNPWVIINELFAEFSAEAGTRDINFEIVSFPNDATIRGDSHHLKRALSRLLENAIKFTPKDGWIRVSGKTLQQKDVAERGECLQIFSESFFETALAEGYLEIAISDSGIGLDKEDQLRIFDKFQEVGDISRHSSAQTSFACKGVGLGLTLAKGIIESHKGLIWVESPGPSQGSCFLTLLPLADPDEGRYVLG